MDSKPNSWRIDDRDTTRGVPPAVEIAATTLLVVGDGELSFHAIGRPSVVIGRGPECDVSIPHPFVSRRHAVLAIEPELTIQDLGSKNGIRVARAHRVGGDPVPIKLGESFQVGPLSCLVFGGVKDVRSPSCVNDVIRVENTTLDGIPAIVRAVAESTSSVLVLGETGVGKDLLSQSIHLLSGRRGDCVRINCAALAESLLESELFGHEKGAFTGASMQRVGLLESAEGGTVFLDEIGELSPALQAKLLRALEARELTRVGAVQPVAIDVRFIAATNRDLAHEVAQGRFRADLYYRLDGVSLLIPPLRERRDQIVPLALQFLAAAQVGKRRTSPATPAFLAHLCAHDWPGNVRELKATVERALLIAAGADLTPAHLIFSKRIAAPTGSVVQMAASQAPSDLALNAQFERTRIIEALNANAGNQTRAAKQLGLSRASLTAKLSLYRIPRPRV